MQEQEQQQERPKRKANPKQLAALAKGRDRANAERARGQTKGASQPPKDGSKSPRRGRPPGSKNKKRDVAPSPPAAAALPELFPKPDAAAPSPAPAPEPPRVARMVTGSSILFPKPDAAAPPQETPAPEPPRVARMVTGSSILFPKQPKVDSVAPAPSAKADPQPAATPPVDPSKFTVVSGTVVHFTGEADDCHMHAQVLRKRHGKTDVQVFDPLGNEVADELAAARQSRIDRNWRVQIQHGAAVREIFKGREDEARKAYADQKEVPGTVVLMDGHGFSMAQQNRAMFRTVARFDGDGLEHDDQSYRKMLDDGLHPASTAAPSCNASAGPSQEPPAIEHAFRKAVELEQEARRVSVAHDGKRFTASTEPITTGEVGPLADEIARTQSAISHLSMSCELLRVHLDRLRARVFEAGAANPHSAAVRIAAEGFAILAGGGSS